MEVAYVAGPYRSRWGIFGIFLNVLKSRYIAKRLWAKGYAVVCPHSNSAFFKSCSEDIILKGYIEILKRCDLVVLTSDWRRSEGAVKEVVVCIESSIPIYKFNFDIDDVEEVITLEKLKKYLV